jgi:hypothetical protein
MTSERVCAAGPGYSPAAFFGSLTEVKCGWQLDAAGNRDVVSMTVHLRRCAMTAPLIAYIPVILDDYATHKHRDVAVSPRISGSSCTTRPRPGPC